MPGVLIAEMLLLVAMTSTGHVPAGTRAYLRAGLAGALLAELAIGGHLLIADDGTVRAGSTMPSDTLLADVYDAVRTHLEGKKARRVVNGLSRHIGGSWNRVVDRLIGTGVLGRDKPSIFRPTRHPVIDTGALQAVVGQVRAAARGEGPVSPEVAVVLALTGPCRLVKQVAPDRSARRLARQRIAAATGEAPFAPAVAKTIDELISAVDAIAASIAASG